VTHDEIVKEIQVRAARRAILTHYCGRAERCAGDPGSPDLVLVGRAGVAWIEVKTAGTGPSPAQIRWKYALLSSGQIWEIIHEHDLAPGGAIDTLLEITDAGVVTL
jgi:hypothetical protein